YMPTSNQQTFGLSLQESLNSMMFFPSGFRVITCRRKMLGFPQSNASPQGRQNRRKAVTLKFLSRVAVFLMCAMLVMALLTTCASKCDAQLETFPPNPFSPFGRADIQVSPMVGAAPGQTLRRTFVNVDSTNTCQEESHIVYCSGNSVVPSKSRDLVPGAA